MKSFPVVLPLFWTAMLAWNPVEAESLPSQFSIEYGEDSEDGRDYFIDLDLAINGPRLMLSYGESDAQTGSVSLDTEFYSIGVSSNPLEEVSVGLSFSEWGQAQVIEIQTLRMDVLINLQDWTLNLAPQRRDIELYTRLGPLLPSVIEVDSHGINLGATYYGLVPWYLGLTYSYHDYSRDVSVLANNPLLALILLPATLEHAFGLEQDRISTDLGYFFAWGNLGLNVLRSVSAVDDSITVVFSVYMNYRLDVRWQLLVQAGESNHSLDQDDTNFASAAIRYQW